MIWADNSSGIVIGLQRFDYRVVLPFTFMIFASGIFGCEARAIPG